MSGVGEIRAGLQLDGAIEVWADWAGGSSRSGGLPEHVVRSVDRIVGNLSREDVKKHIQLRGDEQRRLFGFAAAVRDHYLGRHLFVRAVVEVSNVCGVACSYCEMGTRSAALNAGERYRLTGDEILAAATAVADAGLSTLLLQGGEDPVAARTVAEVLPALKKRHEDLRTIICLGSLDDQLYRQLREAGAEAYILKFETSDEGLHRSLTGRTLQERLSNIQSLAERGFRVGSGLISGLPGTSDESLTRDILLTQQHQFPMCSVSPFVPEAGSPLSAAPPADVETALNVISLLRIANPLAYIPSVSALEQLAPSGQKRGLDAGGNVLTVNCTPLDKRGAYRIYGEKRFVVTREHVAQVAAAAGMPITRGPSIGIETIPPERLPTWFAGRYGCGAGPGDSVYGAPTQKLCEFVAAIRKMGIQDAEVLDLGCGDGRAAIPLAASGGDRPVQVYAVDNSPQAIVRLQERAKHFGCDGRLKAVEEDLGAALSRLGDASARGVVLSNVLYYFDENSVRRILREAWRVLAPGGWMYVSLEVCPRLCTDACGAPTYFRIGAQRNYSATDLEGYVAAECPRSRSQLHVGDVVKRSLPLPPGALACAPRNDGATYTRTFTPVELLVQKEGCLP